MNFQVETSNRRIHLISMGSEQQPLGWSHQVLSMVPTFFEHPNGPRKLRSPKLLESCGFFQWETVSCFFVFGAILICQPIVEIVAEHIETAECTATCVHITRTEFVRNIRFVKDLEKNNEGTCRTMYRKFLGTSIGWIEFCLTVGKWPKKQHDWEGWYVKIQDPARIPQRKWFLGYVLDVFGAPHLELHTCSFKSISFLQNCHVSYVRSARDLSHDIVLSTLEVIKG